MRFGQLLPGPGQVDFILGWAAQGIGDQDTFLIEENPLDGMASSQSRFGKP